MPSHDLIVPSWKENVINVIQFPRAACIPSVSPFSLKLETWLRFNKLNYQNVSNDFKKTSKKGQVPFIELNGRQYADSNFIIENLIKIFNLPIDTNLTTRERAETRAINVLIEESLFRTLVYDRSRGLSWFASVDKGFGGHLTGIKKVPFIQKIVLKQFQNKLKKSCNVQGVGRHSPEEVEDIAKKDLWSLSTLLGDKNYFFGDRPTSVDATAFGHIAQLLYTPLNSDKIKAFIETETPNLVDYISRIKEEFWPDWDELLKTLALTPEDKKKTETVTVTETVTETVTVTQSTEAPPVAPEATPVN